MLLKLPRVWTQIGVTGTWKIQLEVSENPVEAVSSGEWERWCPQFSCKLHAPGKPPLGALPREGPQGPALKKKKKKCVYVPVLMVIQRAWRLRTRRALFFQTMTLYLHKKMMFFLGHTCLVFHIWPLGHQSESSDSAPAAKLGSCFWGQTVPRGCGGVSRCPKGTWPTELLHQT